MAKKYDCCNGPWVAPKELHVDGAFWRMSNERRERLGARYVHTVDCPNEDGYVWGADNG
jgi:hypothetical protein